jgi:hypothetical protein
MSRTPGYNLRKVSRARTADLSAIAERSRPGSPAAAISSLRRIALAVEAGDLPALGDLQWLTAAIRRYETEAPAGSKFDVALGLVPRRGGASWWQEEARRALGDRLLELRNGLLANFSVAAAAQEIMLLTKRARRRRAENRDPLADMDLSERQIRRLIS